MRRFWRFIRIPLFILVAYVGGLLLYGTLTDWAPRGERAVEVLSVPAIAPPVVADSIVRLLTWNVGYGGLGAEDYFYYNRGDFFWTDLGKARTPSDRVDRYVAGQQLTVANVQSDFFLLQEIDTASRRSYYTNQLDSVRRVRPDYATAYAPNFRSRRVPLPLFQPWDHYGRVESGLVSLSRYAPLTSTRIQLPGEFPWPTRLFQLDRCLLRQSFATASGDSLIIYNLHLSAYDRDGSLRRQQMTYLRERVVADQAEGHYVIAGGDWNQIPPGFNWFSLNPTVAETQLPPTISFDYLPTGWSWAYDPAAPTVRKSDDIYEEHFSERSLIDFYLLSPNVRIRQVRTINQGFAFSDHQPVYLEAELLR